MSGPTILVLLDSPDAAAACLRAATDAAAAFEGPRIEVLRVSPDPDRLVRPPDVLTGRMAAAMRARAAGETTLLRAAFDAWRAAAPTLDAVWIAVEGVPAASVRERAALAALLVMTRPSDATHPENVDAFDAGLFETGKPVLAVPPGPGAPFGRHLAVGWRDHQATRHSLAALRPWLMAAATVTLINVTNGEASLPADWQAANLPPGAAFRMIRPAGRSDGVALLQEAEAVGADGLAIGAYRRGRLLERLLGGVTDDVLRQAPFPVLMRA